MPDTEDCSHKKNHSCCSSHIPANQSVHQTLDELDFERGLWNCALQGDLRRTNELLGRGHSSNCLDTAGYTPLHYAARSGHVEVCSALLYAGAHVDAVTRAGHATALHRAASSGKTEVVKLLLRRGADKNVLDADNVTALERAVAAGHDSIVALLSQDKSETN